MLSLKKIIFKSNLIISSLLLNEFCFNFVISMKYIIRLLMVFVFFSARSQVDYSANWRDFFSYNQVVDFTKNLDVVYAITENSLFTYNISTDVIQRFSTVNGLSGGSTSAVSFHANLEKVLVGYEDGVLEIIEKDGAVRKVVDITLSDVSAEKKINSIFISENLIYLALEFGIVVYDLEKYEFFDTYFIGQNSSNINVKDIIIFDGKIYAASVDGVYIADLASNLNDSSNWGIQNSGEYLNLEIYNNLVHVTQGKNVYSIDSNTVFDLKTSVDANIIDVSSDEDVFVAITATKAFFYDDTFGLTVNTNQSSFSLTSVDISEGSLFLGTNEKGILKSDVLLPNEFDEIYIDGPESNSFFSITVEGNDIWCVYGGLQPWYGPLGNKRGVSHFNGEAWTEIPYGSPTGVDNAKDLIHVTVDPINSQKVYVSSYAQKNGALDSTDGGGILVIEDDEFSDFWNAANSGLTNIGSDGGYVSTRIYGSSFDSFGNFWAINSFTEDGSGALKKRSIGGEWSDHSLSKFVYNFNVLKIDTYNNIFVGSLSDGMHVFNEELNKSIALTEGENGLPSDKVKSIAVGIDENIWIGTETGLVLFSDVENMFSNNIINPEPVIIDGIDGASRLLDGLSINDIKVDGAGNVWFATASGGVLQTNSTGKITLNGFNKDNSPLPSNNVLSIGIDYSSGEVYFGTTNGIVSYKTGVATFGDVLKEVYAYPNPVLKNHNQVSITGKSAELPEGTNIKILDVAGNLVFESNAIETQSSFGGKFVWDKRNLAGTKVASGVYIVLLFSAEGQQTSSTKIAIIN
jgi:ligand-binding sensor domain-containing protein